MVQGRSSTAAEPAVLVVGAGPTGLTLAAQLAAHGVAVRIVDQAPQRSRRSRALAVQARTLELFQKMGIADQLIARGRRALSVQAFAAGRPMPPLDFGDIGARDTPFPFVLFVSQVETEQVLEERLQALGVTVERPVTLTGLDQDAGGVEALLRHGDGHQERLRVAYLAGCDGAHSRVRKEAGLAFEGAPYPQDFILADVELAWEGARDRLYAFLSRRGVLVAFPLRGEASYRLIASRAETPAAEAGDPSLEEVQALVERLSPLPMTVRAPQWLARFRLHHRGVDRYRVGRVLVAGDAAHIHSPAGGQGMNTGIQDADNLAWKLALVLTGAPESLLESYHAERHPVGRTLLRFTDRLFALATSRQPLIATVRTFLLPRIAPWLLARPARRARALRFVSQLGIRYRRSPAVEQGPGRVPRAAPRAGDRLGDAPLRVLPVGTETTLFARLGGVGHHLLVLTADDPEPARWIARLAAALGAFAVHTTVHVIAGRPPAQATVGANTYLDEGDVLRRRLGFRGPGLLLVRPDGHLALRAAGTDPAPLAHYLQRVLLPAAGP